MKTAANKAKREDVARKAGVSKAVVTWVLNDKAKENRIPEATVKKVQKAAKELNYKPNIWGKLLNTQKSKLVGFVTEDVSDPAAGELINAVGEALRSKGYGLIIFNMGEAEILQGKLSTIEESFAEGFILHGPSEKILKKCKNGLFSGKPFCILGRDTSKEKLPSVEVDNFLGGKMALDSPSIKKIHRLGVILETEGTHYSEERLRGLNEFLKENPAGKIERYYRKDDENQFQAGASAIEKWKNKMPDLIFAPGGDVMALGALSALNNMGLKCPDDIKVVGFDGTLMSGYASPPLTTVAQPFREMGEAAANICLSLIEGKKITKLNMLLKPSLQIRQSC
jgi:LacI family transcriptional regulator